MRQLEMKIFTRVNTLFLHTNGMPHNEMNYIFKAKMPNMWSLWLYPVSTKVVSLSTIYVRKKSPMFYRGQESKMK